MRIRSLSLFLLLALLTVAAGGAPAGRSPADYLPPTGKSLEYAIVETTSIQLPALEPMKVEEKSSQVDLWRAATAEEIEKHAKGAKSLMATVSQRTGSGQKPSLTITTFLSSDKDGLLVHAVAGPEAASEHYAPPLVTLPPACEAGKSWQMGTMRQQGLLFPTQGSIVGLEDVKTDAGMFKGSLHVKFVVDKVGGLIESQAGKMTVTSGSSLVDDWYAPGVGLVREESSSTITFASDAGASTTITVTQNQQLKSLPH